MVGIHLYLGSILFPLFSSLCKAPFKALQECPEYVNNKFVFAAVTTEAKYTRVCNWVHSAESKLSRTRGEALENKSIIVQFGLCVSINAVSVSGEQLVSVKELYGGDCFERYSG